MQKIHWILISFITFMPDATFSHGNEVHGKKEKSKKVEQVGDQKKASTSNSSNPQSVKKSVQHKAKTTGNTNEVTGKNIAPETKPDRVNINTNMDDNTQEKYKRINQAYQKIIPIFRKACFDCHSNQTKFPWYSKLPIASQIIKNDIENSKEHLVMGDSFPFSGHGTPLSDLKAIKESINSDEMPPLRYKVMHWDAFLSEEQKAQISNWISQSVETLTK